MACGDVGASGVPLWASTSRQPLSFLLPERGLPPTSSPLPLGEHSARPMSAGPVPPQASVSGPDLTLLLQAQPLRANFLLAWRLLASGSPFLQDTFPKLLNLVQGRDHKPRAEGLPRAISLLSQPHKEMHPPRGMGVGAVWATEGLLHRANLQKLRVTDSTGKEGTAFLGLKHL